MGRSSSRSSSFSSTSSLDSSDEKNEKSFKNRPSEFRTNRPQYSGDNSDNSDTCDTGDICNILVIPVILDYRWYWWYWWNSLSEETRHSSRQRSYIIALRSPSPFGEHEIKSISVRGMCPASIIIEPFRPSRAWHRPARAAFQKHLMNFHPAIVKLSYWPELILRWLQSLNLILILKLKIMLIRIPHNIEKLVTKLLLE